MNFEYAIEQVKQDAATALKRITAVEKQHAAAKKFTAKFLKECAKAGISKVAISMKHESIPKSVDFPFSPYGSIFSVAPQREDGWPPIWGVCDRLGIRNGCGNGDQTQADTNNLIDGVYHLKNGVWHRING